MTFLNILENIGGFLEVTMLISAFLISPVNLFLF